MPQKLAYHGEVRAHVEANFDYVGDTFAREARAIHEGNPDPKLLAYQYLQTLPQIANGTANKVWVLPSELTGQIAHLVE